MRDHWQVCLGEHIIHKIAPAHHCHHLAYIFSCNFLHTLFKFFHIALRDIAFGTKYSITIVSQQIVRMCSSMLNRKTMRGITVITTLGCRTFKTTLAKNNRTLKIRRSGTKSNLIRCYVCCRCFMCIAIIYFGVINLYRISIPQITKIPVGTRSNNRQANQHYIFQEILHDTSLISGFSL